MEYTITHGKYTVLTRFDITLFTKAAREYIQKAGATNFTFHMMPNYRTSMGFMQLSSIKEPEAVSWRKVARHQNIELHIRRLKAPEPFW